jgi:predicted DNA-binding protein (UPF0251 family)
LNAFKLRAKIVEQNITMEELAKQIGISTTTLYRKVKYPLRLTLLEVIKLKDILGMTDKEAIDIFLA